MSSRLVLFDTVGLLALWSERDQWHNAATQAHERLERSGAIFVSTTYVLLECGNAAARWEFRSDLVAVRSYLERKNRLIRPEPADWRRAWAAYDRRENAGAGIVDQTSIVIMRRLGITRVFGNDQHFRAAGMETLF